MSCFSRRGLCTFSSSGTGVPSPFKFSGDPAVKLADLPLVGLGGELCLDEALACLAEGPSDVGIEKDVNDSTREGLCRRGDEERRLAGENLTVHRQVSRHQRLARGEVAVNFHREIGPANARGDEHVREGEVGTGFFRRDETEEEGVSLESEVAGDAPF